MSRDPYMHIQQRLDSRSNTVTPNGSPQRYQPGQPLEPIITGETFEVPDAPNPFSTPSQSHDAHSYYPDEDWEPESPQSRYTYDDFEHDVDISEGYHPDQYGHSHYGVRSDSRYSGIRSRSPTPADDDYHVVGDHSVHYTGHHEKVYDEENGYLHPHASPARNLPAVRPVSSQGSSYDDASSSEDREPETPVDRLHFGPVPKGRITRRHNDTGITKRIQLTQGNLVVKLPVPPRLILPYKGEEETLYTTYSGVTCDPDDFEQNGFKLRQVRFKRRTEIMIVITMYNEDDVLFCRTLYGVMKNIAHLCSRKNSRTWGPDSWKKVVVCIVSDGRKKIHPRVLDCLSLLGVYQFGDYMKNMINKKQVQAHLFEHTATFALDPNLHFKYPDEGIVPTQIIFCMKEKNEKKINSHRWCFNAFANMLQPNVVVLLDVGTRPGNNSIYRLWKTFDARPLNSNVAGACGEIAAYKGRRWSHLLNPLVAAQNVEYKLSNILDKTTESVFGYISVLPGAFSAYRYIALQNDDRGDGPLASYFKGESLHKGDPDVKSDLFTSNMYLAEDRILCFELIAKRNSNWVLKYVKGAVAETDVPDNLPEFISQRRRWLNGSFFAATYAVWHTPQILRSGHSVTRKVFLMVQTLYNVINLIFTWFSLGNFYLFFIVLTSSLEDESFGFQPAIGYINPILQYGLAAMIIACFLFSMGNKPQGSPWKYKLTAILFAIQMLYLIVASIFCAVRAGQEGGQANSVMLLSLVITYGCYIYSSIIAMDPWHMINSFIQYILLTPTFINILSIYAFSNLDDISWGTKQDLDPEDDLGAIVQNGFQEIDLDLITTPETANHVYEQAARRIRDRKKLDEQAKMNAPPPSMAEKETAAKAYFANKRANILLSWVLSNGLLLAGILNGGSSAAFGTGSSSLTKGYITFILAFTCITNLIRASGATIYYLTRFILG